MIETEGLTRKFGTLTAVDDLTLHVRAGEVFGFLGPNGAGKTTTVRMLCTLILQTSGTARIGNYEIGKPEDSLRIRKMVGLLPENAGLYDRLSAYRNLDFYARLYEVSEPRRRESVERFLKMLGLWERRYELVGTYSKGMKQKIAIARALIHDPEVLFLDEPTAGLDPEAAKTVRDFIVDLRKEKRTIFLNTHNLDEADRICDRIGVIKTRLIRADSPANLKKGLWSRRTVVHLESINQRIITAVENMSSVKKVRKMENRLILDVDDPDHENPAIVERIVKVGGRVQFVTELRPSLEDVYLKLIRGAD